MRPLTVTLLLRHLDADSTVADWALRRLIRAAARFDNPVGERARAYILAHPEPRLVDPLCEAALNSRRLAAFCATHHLVPSDEVRRAVFLVRTRQHEQYRALDPDGALLALGYEGASAQGRFELRAAMAELGDLDVLRVLARAGGRSRASAPDAPVYYGEGERRYLVRLFAERGDGERVWRLLPHLPLTEAVDAVRDGCGGWRPSDPAERELFEALRVADPAAVRAGVAALSVSRSPRSLVPQATIVPSDIDPRAKLVTDLAFAPDGTRLAFVGGVRGFAWDVDLRDLGSGGSGGGRPMRARSVTGFTYVATRVAHLGDALVVVEGAMPDSTGTREVRRLVRAGLGDGSPAAAGVPLRPTGFEAQEIHDVRWIAGKGREGEGREGEGAAFVVLGSDAREGSVYWIGSPIPRASAAAGGDDPLVDIAPALGTTLARVRPIGPPGMAVDADGRHVAFFGYDGRVAVADFSDPAHPVVRERADGHETTRKDWGPLGALGPSSLVRAAGDELLVWHRPLSSHPLPVRAPFRKEARRDLAWAPALNRFVAASVSHLMLLDTPLTPEQSLRDCVAERLELLGGESYELRARFSPRGDALAVASAGADRCVVTLYALAPLALRRFIDGPLDRMGPGHLNAVSAALTSPLLDAATRETLTLLHACLEHRFSHDIAVGDASAATVFRDDDIALDG
ncbi:hypothetical protein [Streptomyces sp. 6N223]|uniref:hypothetical protein n=1 Tax=Streptomyces sp. 6N223 TaxID=3457412 RepID=UPI003FD5276B